MLHFFVFEPPQYDLHDLRDLEPPQYHLPELRGKLRREEPQYDLPELRYFEPQRREEREGFLCFPDRDDRSGKELCPDGQITAVTMYEKFEYLAEFAEPATLSSQVGSHHVCKIFSSSGEQGLEKGLTIVRPRQVNPSCISSLISRRQ